MGDNFFVDTNIFVYSVADDLGKRAVAEELLMQDGIVISPQVISEFVAVTLRKAHSGTGKSDRVCPQIS